MAQNIRNCWKKLFPLDVVTSEAPAVDQITGQQILNLVRALPDGEEATAEDANDWLDSDAHDPGWKLLSAEEIVNGTEDDVHEEMEESLDEEGEEQEDENCHDNENSAAKCCDERKALESINYVIQSY